MQAVWNGEVIAESDDIVMLEGNAYFPMESLRKDVIRVNVTGKEQLIITISRLTEKETLTLYGIMPIQLRKLQTLKED